jgi:SAM-dependent methyltransferase
MLSRIVTSLHRPSTWHRWAPRLDRARLLLWAQVNGRVLQIGDAGRAGVERGRPPAVLDVELCPRWPPPMGASPFDEGTFDTVLTVLALCRVDDLDEALRDFRRLLAPNGRLLFCEHVVAAGAGASLQRTLAPSWRRATAGCHLERDTLGALRRCGYTIASCEKPARAVLRSVSPLAFGVAVPTLDPVTR